LRFKGMGCTMQAPYWNIEYRSGYENVVIYD